MTAVDDPNEVEVKRLLAHKRTRLCKFFAVGACTRGESCAFAHGSDQLRQQPDFSKTRLCADFVELGRCTLGRKCKFAHGKRELRPGSAAKIGRPGKDAIEGGESEKEVIAQAKTKGRVSKVAKVDEEGELECSLWSRETTLDSSMWSRQTSLEGTGSAATCATSTWREETKAGPANDDRLSYEETLVTGIFLL